MFDPYNNKNFIKKILQIFYNIYGVYFYHTNNVVKKIEKYLKKCAI